MGDGKMSMVKKTQEKKFKLNAIGLFKIKWQVVTKFDVIRIRESDAAG